MLGVLASAAAVFGASDSAWLATLHCLPAAVQLEQVDWLARVLAQRAIPSYLLELQLTLLGRFGERVHWPGSAPTLTLSATLRARRLHALPDFSAYGLRFALSVGCQRGDAHGAGLLVAAAAIDLASGLSDSAATVTDWFKDPAIFSPQWITAVDATFSSASQALRSGG